jgi:flagellar biogenesis protein FliO
MQTQAPAVTQSPVTQFLRSAFGRLSHSALWKRRRDLRVVETISLGNRNFLAVVGYQEQRFLIAGTASSIALLADVTDERSTATELEEREGTVADD